MKSNLETKVYATKNIKNTEEGYKVYRKQEILDTLDKIESELNKMYFDIIKNDEISQYRYNLLMEKLKLIYSVSEAMIKAINACEEQEIIFLKKKYILCTSLIILNSVSLVVAPLLSLPISLALFFNIGVVSKTFNNSKKMKNKKELEEQVNKLDILFHNCEIYLNKQVEKYLDNLRKGAEKENKEIIALMYANDLLGYYLFEEKDIPEYSNEVKECMIKMLQDDLQTDVSSFEELIELSKKKLDVQNISDELGFGINIEKKLKID